MITPASSHFAQRREMEKALQQAAARRQLEQRDTPWIKPMVAGFQTVKRGPRGRVSLPALRFLEERT